MIYKYAIIEWTNDSYKDIAFSNYYHQLVRVAKLLASELDLKEDKNNCQPNSLKFYTKRVDNKIIKAIEVVETIGKYHGKYWWK